MKVHLSLAGVWVPCHANTKPCPRIYHLPNTTPAAAKKLPTEFLRELFQTFDPPTLVGRDYRVWAMDSTDKCLAAPQLFIDETGHSYFLQPHRDHDLPAIVHSSGTQEWYQHGEQHRAGGRPAVMHPSGRREWYEQGQLHRVDGPAIDDPVDEQAWWLKGVRHRADGPALIYRSDGHQEWWVHDQRHRLDGPAIIRADGTLEYWEDDFISAVKDPAGDRHTDTATLRAAAERWQR